MKRSASVVLWVASALLLLPAAGCGPKTMKARVADGERQSDRASGALDDADRALAAGDLPRAEERVKEADRALSDPDVMTNPEADLLKTRLADLKVKIPAVRKQREQEELTKKVTARREVIAKAVTQFRRDISKLEEKPGDRGAFQAARDAARKVHDEMEWDKDLPARDPEFKGYLEGIRQDLQDGEKALATAEKTMAFLDGPVKARDDAAATADKAKTEKNPDEKVKQLTEAQDAYKRCAEDGEKALAGAPGLDKATVVTSPRPLTGALLVKDCKGQVDVTGKLLVSAKKVAEVAAKKAELEEKKRAAAEAKKAAAEARKEELARKKAELEEKKKAAAEAKKAAAEAKKEELARKKAELAEKKQAAAEAKKAAAEARKEELARKKAELAEKKKAAAEAKKAAAEEKKKAAAEAKAKKTQGRR